jgi:NADH-quinone oxidoreductase subunit G/NADP-reducing hydrogenase subunit HndD
VQKITVTIDGHEVQVDKSATILQAAVKAGLKIPTLCYHPALKPINTCRVCVVEVMGARSLMAACTAKVAVNMVVRTDTPLVEDARRTNLQLILSNHPMKCSTCRLNLNCELQQLALDIGIIKAPFTKSVLGNDQEQHCHAHRSMYCNRCVRACHNISGAGDPAFSSRSFGT